MNYKVEDALKLSLKFDGAEMEGLGRGFEMLGAQIPKDADALFWFSLAFRIGKRLTGFKRGQKSYSRTLWYDEVFVLRRFMAQLVEYEADEFYYAIYVGLLGKLDKALVG